ncbi:MAG TPA: response regulator [Puia sp.]|jgi:CheY-like chemotaxis protein|nr:response regulator [Puia sp.]
MKNILIIDEDVDWLTAMRSFFERSGYIASVACSYPEGYDLLEAILPDLIFLDIKTGDPNGLLLYRKIKQKKEFADIPIVVTSHNADATKLYKPYGEAAFLKKPFQLSRLMKTLRIYL